jgi:hypothetical protein
MDSMFPVLVFGLFVVVFALIAYYSYQQQLQRLTEMRALAAELNLEFEAGEDYSYDSEFSQFSIFCHGSSRYAYNTLRGSIRFGDESWPARMGDYHYQTTSHNGKKTTTHNHYFSYVLIELPYASLPDLRIRREGLFDALAGAFGFDDIDFESVEFSKQFHVKSADKKFAYDVCYPQMMEFLLAIEPPGIEIDGGVCCLSDGSSTWSADEFRHRLNWAVEFFGLWPKHLVTTLKSR